MTIPCFSLSGMPISRRNNSTSARTSLVRARTSEGRIASIDPEFRPDTGSGVGTRSARVIGSDAKAVEIATTAIGNDAKAVKIATRKTPVVIFTAVMRCLSSLPSRTSGRSETVPRRCAVWLFGSASIFRIPSNSGRSHEAGTWGFREISSSHGGAEWHRRRFLLQRFQIFRHFGDRLGPADKIVLDFIASAFPQVL